MQGVHKLNIVLNSSNPSKWLKNFCRKECAELECLYNQSLLWKSQGVCAGFLRILEFPARVKIWKDRVEGSSKEIRGLKSPHGIKLRRVDAELFW
jgi:hypothetical protein